MRVSKGHSFSDDQKHENLSSISVFRFLILETNLENKISIYFKFIKRPKVFRARDKRKTNFETNFVFHFQKEVTLAQLRRTSFSDVKNGRSIKRLCNEKGIKYRGIVSSRQLDDTAGVAVSGVVFGVNTACLQIICSNISEVIVIVALSPPIGYYGLG